MLKAIPDIERLNDLLSIPSQGVIDTWKNIPGDLIILGVAGKMGPTLARMARLGLPASSRVIGVARFSDPAVARQLEGWGIEVVRADLLDLEQVARLPDAANVIWMGGMKFGTSDQASLTWAMNTLAPANVCLRYRSSRIVAFSSGNVYGLSPIIRGGSVESDPPRPVGEYACSALGRERIFEHFSRVHSIPMAILRLNYAVEMRYGVLVDIARCVFDEKPVDISMGAFNVIWQGDANAVALQAFGTLATPPLMLNLTGPETLSVRQIALRFGQRFGKPAVITGTEQTDALLNNAQNSHRLFGYPRISVEQMIDWIASWIEAGGSSLNKPTHFDSRDGRF